LQTAGCGTQDQYAGGGGLRHIESELVQTIKEEQGGDQLGSAMIAVRVTEFAPSRVTGKLRVR
jgi:hypothetical protein